MRIGGVVGSSVLAVSMALGGAAFADGHSGSLKDGVVVTKNFKWDGFSIGIGGGYGWADVDRSSELKKQRWKRDCNVDLSLREGVKKEDPPGPDDSSWDYSKTFYKLMGYKNYRKCYYESYETYNDKTFDSNYKLEDRLYEWDYGDPYKYGDPDIYKKQQSLDLDGGIFSAQIGLDRRLGNRFVGGIFADFDKWLGDGDKVYSLVPGKYGPRKAHGDLELDYTATVGARLGILVHNDSTLIYGLAGYTWAQFEDIHWQACHYRKCYNAGKNSLDASGFTLGAGIERKFNDRVSLKAEYRYTDLDEEGFGWDTDVKWKYHGKGPYGKSYHYKQDYDTEIQTVRVLLSFKLGHDRHTPLK